MVAYDVRQYVSRIREPVRRYEVYVLQIAGRTQLSQKLHPQRSGSKAARRTALSSFKYSGMVKQIALQLEVRTHPESGRNLCCIGCLTTAIHAKVYQ